MQIPDLVVELKKAKAHVARLEQQVADREARLAALPATFGFPTLRAFIEAVIVSYRSEFPEKSAPRVLGVPPKPTGLARATAVSRQPAAVPTPAPPATPPGNAPTAATPAASAPEQRKDTETPAPIPSGTSLDDPANFGQLPDFSLLENASLASPESRDRVTKAMSFAQRVMHTSRVPAAVWRQWREFERRAAALLKNGAAPNGHGA